MTSPTLPWTVLPSHFGLLLVCSALLIGCDQTSPPANGSWTLTSPDDTVTVDVQLAEDSGTLSYQVALRDGGSKTTVVPSSPLGIARDRASFTENLEFVSSDRRQLDETYDLVHGKRDRGHAEARELILTLANPDGDEMELVLRAYNEGLAYRYRFLGEASEPDTVRHERTGFRVPSNATGWLLPYDQPSQYTPAYENSFRETEPGTSAPTGAGWGFPALFEIQDGGPWALMTEAGLDGTYAGTHIRYDSAASQNDSAALYRIAFPNPGEGNGLGEVHPGSTLPWTTPWRVIVASPDLAGIVESQLVTHVSDPVALEDTSWIDPGSVSWSWWSDSKSPTDPSDLRNYIDLAAEMGWPYSLVDANWNTLPDDSIRALTEYAAEKQVDLFFWYNSGGPHNTVEEQPRDRLYTAEQRAETFERLEELGVAGIKVDFFQSDKQDRIQQYLAILEDAAEHELMVNFHGSTIPRGWRRTYPNSMTMEAVQGAEVYKFGEDYPETAPTHNTILPFTRNVIGPMDYTPVTFTEVTYPDRTTYGHELALSVVFQSSLQHFADRASAYRGLPQAPKQFLQDVPATWDGIRFLNGYPGDYAILARRKGQTWYIGGITGEDDRTVSVDLSFLSGGTTYDATVITDGSSEDTFSSREQTVDAESSVDVELLPRGGFVMRLVPTN